MKKALLLAGSVLLMIMAGCAKDNTPDESKDPTPGGNGNDDKAVSVSIKADSDFNDEYSATATITLSAASKSDVKVKLASGDVQEGKTKVPADFSKDVTIKAGETTAKVTVKADVMGLKEGDYQAAVKIASAEGADVGSEAVAYFNMSFVFIPEVNLYADPQFASTCDAKITVSLSKEATNDVKVNLVLDPESTADVEFEKTVTIPAGEKSKDVTVTVNVPKGLAAGTYPAIIKLGEIENGVAGSSTSVTINLNYPFSTTVYIDGEFNEWAGALEWPTPAECEFVGIRTLKLAATPQKLFIYFEIVEPHPENFDLYPMPIDIFLDCDGSYDTGGKLTSTDNNNTTLPYVDSGLNWYIELGNVHSGQDYTDFTYGAYKFIGADGASIWSLDNKTGQYGADEMFGVGVLGDDGIGRIEIQIDRTYFELTGTQAQVGVKIMDGNGGWNCYGLSPIGPLVGDASTRVDMALINMPEYEN